MLVEAEFEVMACSTHGVQDAVPCESLKVPVSQAEHDKWFPVYPGLHKQDDCWCGRLF